MEAIDARDSWMRRTGPFYPLLVAAQGQTRLPVAADLDPSGEDRVRARPWWPAVGALFGLGLGIASAILFELGLAAGVVAALIACTWVVAGGAWAELGAARLGERLLSAPASRDAEVEGGTSLAVSFTVALAVSLILRIACLLGTAPEIWIELLIVTAMVGRWTPIAATAAGPLIARLGGLVRRRPAVSAEGEPQEPAAPPLPTAELIATAVVAVVAIGLGGGAGLFALLVAAGIAAAAALTGRGEAAGRLVLAAELGALISFAASDTFPLF